jgi:hypothetical protein
MVQGNHRENANWPGPHVHQALAILVGSLNRNRTMAASRAVNVYPSPFLLILAHVTHCEQAEFRPFGLLDPQEASNVS